MRNHFIVLGCAAALGLAACGSSAKKAGPAPAPAVAPQAPAAKPMGTLSINGFVTNGLAGIDPVFCVDAPSADPAPGPHELQLLGAQAKPLASYTFGAEAPAQPPPGHAAPTHRYFKLLVPAIAFDELVLEAEGVPEVRKRASSSAPNIKLEPVTQASFLPSGKLHVAWLASDADLDRMFVKLEISADDGKTWRELPGIFEEKGSIDLDVRWLKPSDTTRLRASVSDGVRCGRDEVGSFVVAKRPPMVRIRPTYKPKIAKADTLTLRADVGTENGDVDPNAVVWSSSLDGELGRGVSIPFVAQDRSAGKHTITATATDPAGLTASHQLELEVAK